MDDINEGATELAYDIGQLEQKSRNPVARQESVFSVKSGKGCRHFGDSHQNAR
jgi:hypothetical protein